MSFHMNYNTEPRGWIMEEDGFGARSIAKCESIFAQGNGYLNIRCALEESYVGQCRDAFVAGTFNKAMPDEVTELPNLPDVTELVILVNGERFSLDRKDTQLLKKTGSAHGGVCAESKVGEPGGGGVGSLL